MIPQRSLHGNLIFGSENFLFEYEINKWINGNLKIHRLDLFIMMAQNICGTFDTTFSNFESNVII